MRRYTILSLVTGVVAIAMILLSRNPADRNSTIVVLSAPSLTGPMEELKQAFGDSDLNTDGFRVENSFRGSAELLAMYEISKIGDVLVAADVDYHDDFVAAGFCEPPQSLAQQVPCLIYRDVSEEQALSILTAPDSAITTSIPKPRHAAIGRRVSSILGAGQFDLLVQRAKVSRETVSQVAADVSSGVVEVGIAWSTSSKQFPNLKSVVPTGWSEHPSQIGASILVDGSKTDAAQHYQNFLASPDARKVFLKYGFTSAIVQAESNADLSGSN